MVHLPDLAMKGFGSILVSESIFKNNRAYKKDIKSSYGNILVYTIHFINFLEDSSTGTQLCIDDDSSR